LRYGWWSYLLADMETTRLFLVPSIAVVRENVD